MNLILQATACASAAWGSQGGGGWGWGGSSHASSALSHQNCVCLPSSLVPGWLLGPLKSEGQRASVPHNRPLLGAQLATELLGELVNSVDT